MPRVIVLVDRYAPGFKAGGPVRSIVNLVEQLGDEVDFSVITRDRDVADSQAYPNVLQDRWIRVGKAQVHYLSPKTAGLRGLSRLLRSTAGDVLYLNGFFSRWTMTALGLSRAGLLRRSTVVVAPRGEFSPGAVSLKRAKKRAYIQLQNRLRLCAEVVWHATSAVEQEDIERELPPSSWRDRPVLVAANLVARPPVMATAQRPPRTKCAGALNAAFFSRISPKKNLDYLIRLLPRIRGHLRLDIIGPIEDTSYWKTCLTELANMPSNVVVRHVGSVPTAAVPDRLSDYHLVVLPTRGENFGHAIFESLAAGCPVLISDQTAWRGIAARGAGWDLPLSAPDAFASALCEAVEWDQAAFDSASTAARKYAEHFVDTQHLTLGAYRRLFGCHS